VIRIVTILECITDVKWITTTTFLFRFIRYVYFFLLCLQFLSFAEVSNNTTNTGHTIEYNTIQYNTIQYKVLMGHTHTYTNTGHTIQYNTIQSITGHTQTYTNSVFVETHTNQLCNIVKHS